MLRKVQKFIFTNVHPLSKVHVYDTSYTSVLVLQAVTFHLFLPNSNSMAVSLTKLQSIPPIKKLDLEEPQ